MATLFKTRFLGLNKQLLDATGNVLYINGNEVGALNSGNLIASGVIIENQINLLSGQIANSGQQNYNFTLGNAINLSGYIQGVSGNVIQTGVTLYNLIVGGDTNLSGRILQTGQANYLMTLGGDTNLSGFIQSLSGNLIASGAIIENQINLLSGQIIASGQIAQGNAINLSGYAQAISGQLVQTGAIIENQINLLSGQITTSGQTAQANALNLSGSLNQSGALTIGLSGALNASGSIIENQIALLSGQIIATGQNDRNNALNLSGYVLSTSGNLYSGDISLDAIWSGTLATGTALTGSNLQNQINLLSGQIIATGQNDRNNALNLSGNYNALSGALYQTGSTLIGLINGINAAAANAVYTTGTQIISGTKTFLGTTTFQNIIVTGTQTIVNTQEFDVASNFITLNATGGARDAGIFISTGFTGVNSTGALFGFDIPGNLWRFGIGGQNADLLTLPRVASGEAVDALDARLVQSGFGIYTTVNAISGNLILSGQSLQNAIFGGDANLSGRLAQTGASLWGNDINLSGYIQAVSGQLIASGTIIENQISLLSGQIIGSGQIGQGNAINLSGFIQAVSGQLIASGNIIENQIALLSGQIIATGQNDRNNALNLSGSLTQTGTLISNQILALSGIVNLVNGNAVWVTGDQQIAGIKYFTGGIIYVGPQVGVGSANAYLNLVGRSAGASYTGQIYANNLGGVVVFPGTADPSFNIGMISPINGNTLNVGGKGYVSGNLGVGIANPPDSLSVSGGNIGVYSNTAQLSLVAITNSFYSTKLVNNYNSDRPTQLFTVNNFEMLRGLGNGAGKMCLMPNGGTMGIGTSGAAEMVHISGGNLRVDGNVMLTGNNSYYSGTSKLGDLFYPNNSNPSGYITTGTLASLNKVYATGIFTTGLDTYWFNYPNNFTFTTIPIVITTVQVTGFNIYQINVKSVSTTGFMGLFSSPIRESGVIINVHAQSV